MGRGVTKVLVATMAVLALKGLKAILVLPEVADLKASRADLVKALS